MSAKKIHRVNVSYEEETYEILVNIAAQKKITVPELIRTFTDSGINGTLTQNNIDFLTPIIREQLRSVIDVKLERIASMIAKTCIQAGAAAYLSAEAINSFVPAQRQQSFVEAYDAARKKSVQYLRNGSEVNLKQEEGI